MRYFHNGTILKDGQFSILESIMRLVLYPLKSGIIGFSMFFTFILATKFISSVIGTVIEFTVVLDDLLISLIGFVLLFLIRFLENFKD